MLRHEHNYELVNNSYDHLNDFKTISRTGNINVQKARRAVYGYIRFIIFFH